MGNVVLQCIAGQSEVDDRSIRETNEIQESLKIWPTRELGRSTSHDCLGCDRDDLTAVQIEGGMPQTSGRNVLLVIRRMLAGYSMPG